jgi:hypothetical protein
MTLVKILSFTALFFLFLNHEYFGSIGILMGYLIGLTLGVTISWGRK